HGQHARFWAAHTASRRSAGSTRATATTSAAAAAADAALADFFLFLGELTSAATRGNEQRTKTNDRNRNRESGHPFHLEDGRSTERENDVLIERASGDVVGARL